MKSPSSVAAAAAGFLGGEVVAEGRIAELKLETKGGFDPRDRFDGGRGKDLRFELLGTNT